jgi:hypothetical protein
MLAVLGLATSASADTSPPQDAQVGFKKPVQLSLPDEAKEADVEINQMETSAGSIRRLFGKAREEGDVVKVICLDDKLSQADVAVRSGKERRDALKVAVIRNDSELGNHEFQLVNVLFVRVGDLAKAAWACIGQLTNYAGTTENSVQVDNQIVDLFQWLNDQIPWVNQIIGIAIDSSVTPK